MAWFQIGAGRVSSAPRVVMKIILTGATGFVGGRVLEVLLAHPEVELVTCLVRRALGVTHTKVVQAVREDFCRYDDTTIEGHQACIWTLGGKASDFADPVDYARVTHDFPLALARAVGCQPFRFCYLSGMGADPTERACLPWERTTRHLKGRTERDLDAVAKTHPQFRAHSFRPGGVLLDAQRRTRRWLAPITVSVSELGQAMARVALDGDARPLLLNRDIQRLGDQTRQQPPRQRGGA